MNERGIKGFIEEEEFCKRENFVEEENRNSKKKGIRILALIPI